MLASDLNNPEFTNPQNPDAQLYVEFFWHEPEGPAPEVTSVPQGRLERTPYVRVMVPGNDKTVIETPVREDHKARWPQKWLAWQMREGLIEGASNDVPGWRLRDWGELQENQLRELEFLRFSTVEQLAGASDGQIQRLGMGGLGLRERARAAVKGRIEAEIRKATAKQEEEIATLRAKDAEREREMAAMRAMMAELAANQKKRPGRKPKGAAPVDG